MFKLKCQELYAKWFEAQSEPVPGEAKLQFSNKWVAGWMQEYRVSLNKPNKRFSLAQEERVIRLVEIIKNVWRARYYMTSHVKKEPVIMNGDQMPLHRNESSTQKTMTLTGEQTYVKENYMLSRERITVYTQVSSDAADPMPLPEFVFKGKGTYLQSKLNIPDNVHVQWAAKGSYRLETMLGTISHLKNRSNPFTDSNNAIYILDDYSVHVTREVRQALRAIGYIPICIGGGITGDIQINDTHVHHKLKMAYREREAKLMLEMLNEHPNKIPSPTRDDIMPMLVEAWQSINVDPVNGLKENFLLNAFDGSEDHLVSDKLYAMVGPEMVTFRKQLLLSAPPRNIEALMKTITLPKGVKITAAPGSMPPPDEGVELYDCEGDELEDGELLHHEEPDVDDRIEQACSTPTHAESTSVSLSNISNDEEINADSSFLDGVKTLFDQHTNTSTQFITFMCQFRATYSRARSSIKRRLKVDPTILKSLKETTPSTASNVEALPGTSTAANVEPLPGTSTAANVEPLPGTSTASASNVEALPGTSTAANVEPLPGTSTASASNVEPLPGTSNTSSPALSLHIGSFLLVKNGQNCLPACVVRSLEDGLAVQYYEQLPDGKFTPQDCEFSLLKEDVVKMLPAPNTSARGRRIYYEFTL